jgi:hypothetical protein
MMSGSSAVVMNLLLMSPKFRRWVRIPKVATEEQNPYKKLVSNFKLRFHKFMEKLLRKKS